VTGLMLEQRRNDRRGVAPNAGGGWLEYDVREMKRLMNHWRPVEAIVSGYGEGTSPCENNTSDSPNPATRSNETNSTYSCEQTDFDVVVHQFAVSIGIVAANKLIYICFFICYSSIIFTIYFHHMQAGWLVRGRPLWKSFYEQISWDAIDDTVRLAFDYLGATTVILQTVPIHNNVNDMNELRIVNQRIWKYARDFNNSTLTTNGIQRKVLVMDVAAFSVSLFLQNSMSMGLISNKTGEELQMKMKQSTDFDEYLNLTVSLDSIILNQRLAQKRPKYKFRCIIGHVCGEAVPDNTPEGVCKKSIITDDGMHWCMGIFSGRTNAGLACLLRCSLDHDTTGEALVACERHCNVQYMSLAQVAWDDGKENENKMVELVNY